MKHLTEEQLIDILMGEQPPSESALEHLAQCEECADRLTTLEMGLDAAKRVKPRMPLTAVPVISYNKFAETRKASRNTWLAVAAMFFLAIVGLRVQVGGNGVNIQFALFDGNQSNYEARIAELEYQVAAVSEMAGQQLDDAVNSLLLDVDKDMGEFSAAMNVNFTEQKFEYERKILELKKALEDQRREDRVREMR